MVVYFSVKHNVITRVLLCQRGRLSQTSRGCVISSRHEEEMPAGFEGRKRKGLKPRDTAVAKSWKSHELDSCQEPPLAMP